MSKRQQVRSTSSAYARSYLVTLGLAFVSLGVFLLLSENSEIASGPWWGLALLAAFLLGGLGLVVFGLLGPSTKMEKWANDASTHEASILLMVLAYPVYLALAPFYDRR